MFSLEQVIALLYVERDDAFREEMLALCETDGREYYETTWKVVAAKDLGDRFVQANLARTLFQSQFTYWGAVSAILKSLEDWSERTVVFSDLPYEDMKFYERYYAFLGFVNFGDIDLKRKLFLLGREFLLLACVWDLPVYVNVQEHFTRIASLGVMENDALLFLHMMQNNPTEYGDPGTIMKPLSEWITNFDDALVDSSTEGLRDRVDHFFQDNVETSRLSEEQQKVLNKVFTLYWGLQGGFIWREIEDTPAAGYELKEQKDGASVDENYLHLLYRANDEQFFTWLHDYEEVVYWIAVTKQPEEFIIRLFFVLLHKVDLNNMEQVQLVLQLCDALKKQGLQNVDEILYFDEKTQKFQWDEAFFIGATA